MRRPGCSRAALALSALVLLAPACATRVAVGDGITDDVPAPEAYAATVRARTRELRLYEGLTTALLARATYLDADLRRAAEQLRAHLLLLEPALRQERLAAAEAAAAASHEVVLAVASEHRDDLVLGTSPDHPWRVRAFVDGRPCTPEAVERWGDASAVDLRLLPHVTPWDTLWRARFAKDCGDGGLFELQLTGGHGTGELGWRL